ncbi:MAG: panthothenate kinase [Bacteriovoracaceae bacterium]|nr:panthothenate kinase [Bacteriovoracaceae bacterium]
MVFDGIFLHREEVCDYWDYSVFLDASFGTTYQRMAKRDGCPADFLDEKNTRYYQGQLIYLNRCNPMSKASMCIDNNDFNNPKIF